MREAEQRRATYRSLCARESSIPLFSQAFWLDTCCGSSGWDVAFAGDPERIDATLAYRLRRVGPFSIINMPLLTQTAGPWLRSTPARQAQRLAREKDLMTDLIERTERQSHFSSFYQQFHPSVTNWLPFYWRGYTASTRYTYVLDDLSDLDSIWKNMLSNIRGDVRKAESRSGLTVVIDDEPSQLLKLASATFARQKLALPYSTELMSELDRACRERSCRRIFRAHDAGGNDHAALYLVWDADVAYYLIAGADSVLRASGAQSLLAWEAIRFAATVSRSFDFEGSMLEPVERFVRAFGAHQVPYFAVSKLNSSVLELRASYRRLKHLAVRKRGGSP